MQAAVLHAPRDLSVETRPDPEPGSGEVVVRVQAVGLCGTDYSIWIGDRPVAYPRIMGHEILGVVEGVGPGAIRLRAGDPVVVEPNYSCGQCALCREGNWNLCARRTAIGIDVDGGLAERVRVPARCCWPVPPGLAADDALLAEPLAVVVRAVRRGAPRHGECAAVVGAGTLGLLAVQVLRTRGVRVLVVSRSPRRLPLARALGADATATVGEGALEIAAQQFSRREGVDLVIETAGTAEAVSYALALVRPGGRVVLTGLPHEPTPVHFFGVVRREITLRGSMIYQDEFRRALELLRAGAVSGRRLITHRFDLARVAEALVAHRDPLAIKVAVLPNG